MIEIFEDLFDIVKRIKSIDSNYKVFRNQEKKRYEIYYQYGLNLNLELVVPHEHLDARTINLLNKSKVENADSIFQEIDKYNEAKGVVWN